MPNHREPFPKPSPGFVSKKTKILQQLAVPEAEYTDASPKGTIDEGIRDLIGQINDAEGFVTTSSCAGRVSVFVEGRKAGGGEGEGAQVAGVGGKGAGGTWLFVSHDVVEGEGWAEELALMEGEGDEAAVEGGRRRLIHFKFEPMILHILTASAAHAQALLQAALQAGFRESGALNITPQADSSTTPLVAIRSMGLALESLIGYEKADDGSRRALVTRPYLQMLMGIASERFAENEKRIARFRGAFRDVVLGATADGSPWEDAATRRERMREEGLRRREALRGDGDGGRRGGAI